MSVIHSLLDRENGTSFYNYDIALGRLKCYTYDEFYGISPSTDGPDFNPYPPVFACNFCTKPGQEHLLALANEDGKVAIQNTKNRSDHKPFEGHQAHRNAIFDLAWSPNDMKIVTASGDHTAALWDISDSHHLQEISRFHAHTRSVKTVTYSPEDKNIFATGGRDNVIMIWDTRTLQNSMQVRPDNFIVNTHSAPGTPGSSHKKRKMAQTSSAKSVTGLVFQDSYHLISCGTGDGKLKIWDLRKSYCAYRKEAQPQYCLSTSKDGFTCLTLDPSKLKLYASCLDNTIYCYNVATYENEPVALFKGHETNTFYVKACLSPDGRYLLSGSSDEKAYIWNTNVFEDYPDAVGQPLVKLVGHRAEVTGVAWCPVGETKIVTCSDDDRHCLWRVGLEHDQNKQDIHGYAEPVCLRKSLEADGETMEVSSPVTPCFRSIKRWKQPLQRTPDNAVYGAPIIPAPAFPASRKRLEVMYEVEEQQNSSDKKCPECDRESKQQQQQKSQQSSVIGSDFPRRLFSPVKSVSEENNSDLVIKKNDERSPIKQQCADTLNSESGVCPLKNIPLNDVDAPGQTMSNSTTVSIQLCARHRLGEISSPTLNLPNYVIDGTSPHHSCSPNFRQKENVDWLTRYGRERNSSDKKAKSSNQSQGATTGSTSGRTSSRPSASKTTTKRTLSVNSKTPKRRSSVTATEGNSSSGPSSGNDRSVPSSKSLLKYIRVTKTRETQCSGSEAPHSNALSTNQPAVA